METTVAKRVTLEEVFSPRTIAVVGASELSLKGELSFGGLIVLSLVRAGFPAIYPVNPRHAEQIYGLPCYPDLLSIPGPVDHVVVNIPAEACLGLLDECAAKGVRSVHFYTAGFSESGQRERADLEQAMLEKAKAGGFRIIGPNCVGLYVPKNRLTNSPSLPLETGPVAFITQSGGHSQNLPMFGAARGIRFSKVVSYGNALDINECELIEYLAEDPDTEIIAAYLEGVKDGPGFFHVLKRAASRKPLIIYKGGKTEAGSRAVFGHTASMTSSAAVFASICRQANAIQVDNIEEMIDVIAALRFMKPIPEGKGVAIVGSGGGPSVLACDEMESEGLSVPRLSDAIQEELKSRLPIAGSIFTNPIDTLNLISPKAMAAALAIAGKSPDIHALVYHLGFHPIGGWGPGRFSSPAFLGPAIDAVLGAKQASG
jgi:acyl-CoA synthetase (NDP forming)